MPSEKEIAGSKSERERENETRAPTHPLTQEAGEESKKGVQAKKERLVKRSY